MSEKGVRAIAKALAKGAADEELRRFGEEIRQKNLGENSAIGVINRSIEKWTGHLPNAMGQLPLVRDGKLVGYSSTPLASLMSPHSEARTIASGVWAENTSTLRARLSSYKRLEKSLKKTVNLIDGLDIQARARILRLTSETTSSLEEKLVVAMGSVATVVTASALLGAELQEAIVRCQDVLENRAEQRGRSREEARYVVAERFAKLFTNVTGEIPTYSKDENGFHGKFSPALRDLFDVLGWRGADLEGPATAACAAVLASDFELPENPTLGGILGLPLK